MSLPPRAAARPGAGEREALAAFLLVLETEERALVSGDVEAIDAATREKSGWLARLAALAADPSPPSELIALRQRAREANERNGRLVAVRLARLRQRLEALGAAPAAGAAYGADGLSRAPLASPGSRRSVV